ncbi:hypothetical protein [Streptomyces sp. NPDC050504]|uniref:hypothetical protein n=1 Tax=Streptomyces sp. NPDC050504 TaxID=3365618 RepID=UPI00379846CF
MSISHPLWDADTQGWSAGGRAQPETRPRPGRAGRARRARRTGWARWARWGGRAVWRRSRGGRTGAVRAEADWDQAIQGWDVRGDAPAAGHRAAAWPRRWTALALLSASGAVALLAGWWPGTLFLVWSALLTAGITAVRSRAAGVGAAPGVPAVPDTPGRAFARGLLTVLVFPRAFHGLPAPPAAPAPPPVEARARVEESLRRTADRLAEAAHRSDEDLS